MQVSIDVRDDLRGWRCLEDLGLQTPWWAGLYPSCTKFQDLHCARRAGLFLSATGRGQRLPRGGCWEEHHAGGGSVSPLLTFSHNS